MFAKSAFAVIAAIIAIGLAVFILRDREQAYAANGPKPASVLDVPQTLTFSDDFRKGIDRNVWTLALATYGEANPAGELQHYRPEEVTTLPGGGLRLSSTRKTFEGKHITAGAINSADGFSQTYGHFEIKAKLAGGPGTWPAFWLMPNDSSWPPEIDIFEYLGRMPKSIHVGAFAKGPDGKKIEHGDYVKLDFDPSENYHVYALDWRPDVLIWSIDGKEIYRVTEDIPQRPMNIILNLAYGGSWAGPVTDTTPFPGQFDIQYVRVYQYDDLKNSGAIPFLQFTKLNLDGREYRSGDVVPISGNLKVGKNGVKSAKVNIMFADFSGAKVIAAKTVSLGDIKSGTVVPFTAQISIPAGAKAGLYNVTLIAEVAEPVFDPSRQAAQTRIYRGIADQFEITE